MAWINRSRHLTKVFQGLCVPQEVIDKSCLCGPKEPLFDRSSSGIRSRALQLRDIVIGQQRLKIDGVEISTAIDHQNLRQPLVASHAFAYYHHVGAVAWRIERQVHGRDSPTVRV